MKIIISLTETGKSLGQMLQHNLVDVEHWHKPQPFAEKVQAAFQNKDELIMICATGIVFRTLAPVLESKHDDPAVLVIDEIGRYVVPMLSGHEGGANHLGDQIAQVIGAEVVITTANPFLKPVYSIGMGCERGCEVDELKQLLRNCLDKSELSIEQIDSINSIDVKKDEVGLIALSDELKKPFEVFNKTQLLEEDALLSTRSDYVFETVGVYGVAESSALFAAATATGNQAELILNKTKSARATCAIARSYPSLEIEEALN